MAKLIPVQFMPYDLSDEAYEYYSNNSFYYFTDSDGCYYEADNKTGTNAACIGSSLQAADDYMYSMWLDEN